jgi:hypothetical protein
VGSWNVVPSPNTGSPNNYLFGVAAIASNDVWAVGAYGVLGISAHQVAVSAVAPNDVRAVGGYDSGGQALIQHWNGATWNVVTNPNPDTLLAAISLSWLRIFAQLLWVTLDHFHTRNKGKSRVSY